MSDKEQAAALLDRVPASKLGYVIAYLQGLTADEAEDDAYCAELYQDYLNDADPHKNDTVTLEALAADLGVQLP